MRKMNDRQPRDEIFTWNNIFVVHEIRSGKDAVIIVYTTRTHALPGYHRINVIKP